MKKDVLHERFARQVPGAARNGLTTLTYAVRMPSRGRQARPRVLPSTLQAPWQLITVSLNVVQIDADKGMNRRPRKPFCCHVVR